ncbi:hypothetical protein CEUSTIGMA_g10351.t1 [Chlamydomonas eustigma]|uniref:Large ribosomal subunit protein bL9c n=1 Tax=Chlamydomonas eustigma TaxID=1157962 RepID=A0A250XIM2_9CHLO|nr:hypothetical protein CEUSTIGMA_g10351.t1 [Chlamydomonas eustigma]|eukprot:GAX82924.1 hypothetical protein CEUSTIGMA_g10351.t1 [Chlamydomonas eustigma]
MLKLSGLQLLKGLTLPLTSSLLRHTLVALPPCIATSRAVSNKIDASISGSAPVETENEGKVKVVLLRSVSGLGAKGSVVDANAGWMRLQLFPRKAAVYATPENILKYSMTMEERLSRQDPKLRERFQLEGVMNILCRMHVSISRKHSNSSDPEAMVGTVTSWDIVKAALIQGGVQLDVSHLMMSQPISAFGTYKVPLNLRTRDDRQVELTVIVNSVKQINYGKSSV